MADCKPIVNQRSGLTRPLYYKWSWRESNPRTWFTNEPACRSAPKFMNDNSERLDISYQLAANVMNKRQVVDMRTNTHDVCQFIALTRMTFRARYAGLAIDNIRRVHWYILPSSQRIYWQFLWFWSYRICNGWFACFQRCNPCVQISHLTFQFFNFFQKFFLFHINLFLFYPMSQY